MLGANTGERREGISASSMAAFSGIGLSPATIAADILRIEDGRLAKPWEVLQDGAVRAGPKSGRPMLGEAFPS